MSITGKCKAHKVAMFRKDAPLADLCSFQLLSLAPFLSLLCISATTQEMLTVDKMQRGMPSNTIPIEINEPLAPDQIRETAVTAKPGKTKVRAGQEKFRQRKDSTVLWLATSRGNSELEVCVVTVTPAF